MLLNGKRYRKPRYDLPKFLVKYEEIEEIEGYHESEDDLMEKEFEEALEELE